MIKRLTPIVAMCLLLVLGLAQVAPAAQPTLMVMMEEKVMGVFGTTGFEQPGQADATIAEIFRRQGVRVLDSATVKRNVTQAKGLRMLEGDDKAAAAVGLQYGAQYSIVGRAISKTAGAKLYGTQMQSIQATVNARLIRNDDARVLGYASAQAAQAHIDEVRGGAMAIEKASREVANQLLGHLPSSAGSNAAVAGAASGNELTLNINGLVSYRHLDFVMTHLEEKTAGVSAVELLDFTSGTARLIVHYAHPGSKLARNLATQRFTGFRLEPTHVTGSRLDVRAVLNKR